MADKDKKPSIEELYKKVSQPMSVEEYLNQDHLYEDAKTDALNKIKGKRVKDYKSGLELLTDALITFRKASKHPHASEDKEHRHMYAGEMQQFFDAYAKQNNINREGIERMLKTAKGRRDLIQAYMDNEQQQMFDSNITYKLEGMLPSDEGELTQIAQHHLEQNPHLKKQYSTVAKKKLLGGDKYQVMNEMKGHYMRNLDTLIRDYKPKDEKK
jgi:hypothetical protein